MTSFIAATVAVLVTMHIVCLVALKNKRNDYADIAWGPLFVIGAAAAILFLHGEENPPGPRALLVFLLVSIWGVRLFLHVGLRNLKKTGEDARYAKWRKEWGNGAALRSYGQVFLLQSAICLVILSSVLVTVSHSDVPLDAAVALGTIVWLIGFFFESVADRQLDRFIHSPGAKGKLMTTGLWSWSRHPNYFGEVVQWWGIFLFAVPLPAGLWTIVSPLTITFLILKVSGVPMLEEMMKHRPGFADYAKRTSVFFPRPPRKA